MRLSSNGWEAAGAERGARRRRAGPVGAAATRPAHRRRRRRRRRRRSRRCARWRRRVCRCTWRGWWCRDFRPAAGWRAPAVAGREGGRWKASGPRRRVEAAAVGRAGGRAAAVERVW